MRTLRFALATLALAAAPLAAQAPAGSTRTTVLAPTAIAYRISELNGWGFGPALSLQTPIGSKVLFEASAWGLLSSTGFYDYSGIGADIGVAYAVRGPKASLAIGLGGTVSGGGDSDGTGGGFGGGYASLQGTAWLSPRVGVTSRLVGRVVAPDPRFAPSASLGLAFTL